MATQCGNKASIMCHIKKEFQGHPEAFSKYYKTNNHQNNYVLTPKLQLGWQKVCICMCVCAFAYMCKRVTLFCSISECKTTPACLTAV